MRPPREPRPTVGLLASVMTPEEAAAAVTGGADIIDLKDPRRGALGALPAATIGACIARVGGRRPVSATVGDLPMEPASVGAAVAHMAAFGLDFVKLGIFPGGDPEACLAALAQQARRGVRLVAVLFADQGPDFALIPRLRECGFAGVMLDTADKTAGGLRDQLAPERLAAFVETAHEAGLIAGLAGALRRGDIAALLPLAPDYLGFRGALTLAGRSSGLDPAALAAVRRAIPMHEAAPPAWRQAAMTGTD